MIILEAGLLTSQDDCYFANKTNVNWQKLNGNLGRFAERYGAEMREVVEVMLGVDWRARPDWVEMEGIINRGNSGTTVTTTVEVTELHQQQPAVIV
jgi:hypothetical protein